MLGRITLNPLAHIDWIGTVLFPLLAMLSGLAAARLGEAGAGRIAEPASAAPGLRDRCGGRSDQQSACSPLLVAVVLVVVGAGATSRVRGGRTLAGRRRAV